MGTKDDLLFIIKSLDLQIKKRIVKIYKSHKINISASKVKILLYLKDNNNVTNTDLERITALSKSSVSEIITSMEKEGLIIRENSKIDNRVNFIKPTKYALSILDIVKEEIDNLSKSLEKSITKEELEIFYKVITKMKNNLETE